MDRDFHERLRQGFLEIARGEPERCVVIDAAQDEDSVHAAIVATLGKRLVVSSAP
jgi:dTMP kinase